MQFRVHVLDRISGRVLAAELCTDNAQPVILVEGRPTDDWERFELLPFPMENELGAASWGRTL
jgi:hypothetical protein